MFRKYLLILLIAFIPQGFMECSRSSRLKDIEPFPTDSLFTDLDRITISRKAGILNEVFQNLHKRYGFNGCVVYSEKGRKVYEAAFGFADFKKKTKLTVHSAFQLASVSKMFTAMAIMVLKENGKLDYDDPLIRFVPEFPDETITIRQLLTHRSGLTNYMYAADDLWERDNPLDNEDVVSLFSKHEPDPYFTPDNGFHYCNTNYALLASVVERITGQHFDEFMEEAVFKPAGMKDAFIYNLRNASVVPDYVSAEVQGHRPRRRGPIPERDYYQNGVMGDKGVYASVEDLYNWDEALNKELLVSHESLQEAFQPGSPKYRRRNNNYGFGWRIKDGRDSTVFHYGWWKGFRSFYIKDLKQEKSLIVVMNIDRPMSANFLWDIIDDHRYELGPVSEWPQPKTSRRKRKH